MANLFDVYKVFRPGTTILSDDFNSFQSALVGAFSKLGTTRSDNLTGVEEAFSVGTPTAPTHAVRKDYYESSVDALSAAAVAGELASQVAAADGSATASATSATASANSATASLGYFQAAQALDTIMPSGTTNSTMRYNGSNWAETDKLQIDSAGVVTATVGLRSTGAGANSFRAGTSAGATSQGSNTVAVGKNAATSGQGNSSVAVGNRAGDVSQGGSSVAVGALAGQTSQGANGVIISGKGVAVDDTTVGHIHIASNIASLDYAASANWNFTGGGVTASSFTGSGAGLTNIAVPLTSMAAVTTPLTGAELIPVLQGSSSSKLTTSEMFGSAGQEIQGLTQNRIRVASHLGATTRTYTGTNGAMWGNEPLESFFSGTGASVNQAGSFTTGAALGAAGMYTGTTTTGLASAKVAFGDTVFTSATGDFDVRFLAKVSDIATSAEDYVCRLGFYDSATASPTLGIWFEYNRAAGTDGAGANGDKWICVTQNGAGNTTRNETTIAVATTSYQTFRVQYKNNSGASGTASFYIDNVLVKTITTNIPASIFTFLAATAGYTASIQKTAGTTSRVLYLDAFSLDYANAITTYL